MLLIIIGIWMSWQTYQFTACKTEKVQHTATKCQVLYSTVSDQLQNIKDITVISDIKVK